MSDNIGSSTFLRKVSLDGIIITRDFYILKKFALFINITVTLTTLIGVSSNVSSRKPLPVS